MNIKGLFLTALAALALTASCGRKTADEDRLQTGDLVFVGIPMDYSLESGSMDEAITSATGTPDSLNLIHVAIAEVKGDSTWIIDATIKHGVDRHPLDTFLRDFTLKDGSLPTFIVKRLKDPSGAEAFVEKAKGFTGLPYDVHFLPDNGALYCSELVRDSYMHPDGSYAFDTVPMNFMGPDGEFPLYWKQLFALIGEEIPQGVPGTNPQEMSESPELRTVNVCLTDYANHTAMDKFKLLVVVDVQRDFFDPSGSLYVPGSEELPEKIASKAEEYDAVVFTMDWHPGNHCSFKEQGGPWPSHCVAYTEGAGLADCFSPILALGPDKVAIFEKGKDPLKEQYGAFETPEEMGEGLLSWFNLATEIDVCGIAGDYCVKESTANLLKYVPAEKVTMLPDCIRSIDDGSALKAFIEENGLKVK